MCQQAINCVIAQANDSESPITQANQIHCQPQFAPAQNALTLEIAGFNTPAFMLSTIFPRMRSDHLNLSASLDTCRKRHNRARNSQSNSIRSVLVLRLHQPDAQNFKTPFQCLAAHDDSHLSGIGCALSKDLPLSHSRPACTQHILSEKAQNFVKCCAIEFPTLSPQLNGSNFITHGVSYPELTISKQTRNAFKKNSRAAEMKTTVLR